MDYNALGQMVSQYGFPIVVAGYLLVRMETTIKELTKSVDSMNIMLVNLTKDNVK